MKHRLSSPENSENKLRLVSSDPVARCPGYRRELTGQGLRITVFVVKNREVGEPGFLRSRHCGVGGQSDAGFQTSSFRVWVGVGCFLEFQEWQIS